MRRLGTEVAVSSTRHSADKKSSKALSARIRAGSSTASGINSPQRSSSSGSGRKNPPRRSFSNTKASRKLNLALPDGSGHNNEPLAVPGRPKRKRRAASSNAASFWKRFSARWYPRGLLQSTPLILAICLWYSLGIVSIGTSKVLLSSHNHRHATASDHSSMSPLMLTFQQLVIGTALLRFLLHIRFLNSPGLLALMPAIHSSSSNDARLSSSSSSPIPMASPRSSSKVHAHNNNNNNVLSAQQLLLLGSPLIQTGICFTIGFYFTNMAFHAAAPSFVETIKAAEPLTSATVATLGGIEVLSQSEQYSLGVLVSGVLLSTIFGGHSGVGSSNSNSAGSFWNILVASIIVMGSNICFSFKGYFQKVFRLQDHTLDDLNVQFRLQQTGVVVLAIPVLAQMLWQQRLFSSGGGLAGMIPSLEYVGLALLNGCAFTSYNLASTFVLTRLSVVHHAALNCLRRVVAVAVTSILFQVRLSFVGVLGIIISVMGFLSFTHYKTQRQRRPKNVSSLLPQRNRSASSATRSIPQGAPSD